jgi:hypothetical protein
LEVVIGSRPPLALHAGGRLDELAIAAAAFLVLWLAVKLAWRQPVQDEGEAGRTNGCGGVGRILK